MNAEVGTEVVAEAVTAEAPKVEEKPTEQVDASATQEKQQERAEDGKFRKPVQPRIDELTRGMREAEREAVYWRQRAEAREKAEQEQASAKAAEKPDISKYASYDEYVEALAEWKADQKISAKLDERDKKAAERTQAEKRDTTWRERLATAVKEIPDLSETLSGSTLRIKPHVEAILMDSDLGPHLALHLHNNPDVADRLNSLPEAAANREIGRIEAQISAAREAKTREVETSSAESKPEVEVETTSPAPRRTQAPAPAKPLSSGRSTTPSLATATMEEFKAQRKAQGARWAR